MIQRLIDCLIRHARRHPYRHIYGRDGLLYMERFWIVRERKWLPFAIRVHHIVRSDADRALHDHPWCFMSIILRGGYFEVLPLRKHQHPMWDDRSMAQWWRRPGSVIFHRATTRHRVSLTDAITGGTVYELQGHRGAWTLVVTGRRTRTWGFHTAKGFVEWWKYLGVDPNSESA